RFRCVLLVGVEVLSRVLDWSDRNTCVLFGDGAGAVVLTPLETSDERGILSTHLYADGAGVEWLNIPGGGTVEPTSARSVEARRPFVKMEGKPIFSHAVKKLASAAQAALDANRKSPTDVDCVVAHQANLRILEGVAERTGLAMSKFYLNLQKYGNTSSASI